MTYQAPGQVHEQARQELFAGAQPAAGPAPGATNYGARGGVQQLAREDLEYMDGRQIMDHAVAQHKDTTATARRALQVVEQTKELQASTVGALQDQGQQLVRIGHGMNKVSAAGRAAGTRVQRGGAERACTCTAQRSAALLPPGRSAPLVNRTAYGACVIQQHERASLARIARRPDHDRSQQARR